MKYHVLTAAETLSALESGEKGLSQAEAESRLAEQGRNALEKAKKKSLVMRIVGQIADPMVLVLIAAAAVSGIVSAINGEALTDVFIILAVVVLNTVLGLVQEGKAERAVEALSDMNAATARVMRDGKTLKIPAEEVVTGDIIALEAGDSVPADARLIECHSFSTEEAALTGESLPSEKNSAPSDENAAIADRSCMVYAGGSVAAGRARAVVTATGMRTELGKIAAALASAGEGATPLQKKLSQLSKILTLAVLAVCVVVFAVSLIRGGFAADNIMNGFMLAVSLAVAAIPEGLAAVVTVVLSMGVTKMSAKRAFVRRLSAVETLGCTGVICTDKTGTLTKNKMAVTESFGNTVRLSRAVALCSDANEGENGAEGEPTEAALVDFACRNGVSKSKTEKTLPRIDELPFDSDRKLMSTFHREGDSVLQLVKGAPDVLIARCVNTLDENGDEIPFTEELRTRALYENASFADKALRVIAAAERHLDAVPSGDGAERNLTFIGLAGMSDPVRPEAVTAMSECRAAGIKTVMITGDHPATAAAIGRQLGMLGENEKAVTGTELAAMTDTEFDNKVGDIAVYARVMPEQKLRIVKAWQKKGFVTAMTGDGVNDAPAIKTADIGVGMGITGTDVTRGASDMVLADDNFATIVGAVSEGRRIYDNIRKAVQYLLSSNLSEVAAIFTSTMLGFTILNPVHILWINLITDTMPALSLGMEEPEADNMTRPPRPSSESVFSGGVGFATVRQGLIIAAATVASYVTAAVMADGGIHLDSSTAGMTAAFLTLSLAEIFHAFNMRSRIRSVFTRGKQNKWLIIAALVAFSLTALLITVPFLREIFGFAAMSLPSAAIATLFALIIVPIEEIIKLFKRKNTKSRGKNQSTKKLKKR